MAKDNHNRDVNEKQPGEKPEGAQHYNPGNQSGKSRSVPADHQKPDEKLPHKRPTQP
jgi:hypothetical protein